MTGGSLMVLNVLLRSATGFQSGPPHAGPAEPAGRHLGWAARERSERFFKVVRRSAAVRERSERVFFAEQEKKSHFVRHRRGAADYFPARRQYSLKYSSTVRLNWYRSTARARPAAPRRAARSGSRKRRRMASAQPPASPRAKSKPSRSCRTISGFPPTFVTITGSPLAIASKSVSDAASLSDVSAKAS